MGVFNDVFGAGKVSELISKVLDYFPNAAQRAEAEKHLQDIVATVQTQQSEINKAEASTGSLFLAGWRPFVAWNCGAVFCINLWMSVFGYPGFSSELANNTLYLLLGLGTWRTADKVGGAATAAIKKIFKK